METRSKMVKVSSDLSLDVGVSGNATGRPVILIHGLSDSWRSFLPLMRELPQHLRLIAVSLRGHGDSSKTAAGYSLAEVAGDVLAVMHGLGLSAADVVGHSLGSLVAQKLAQLAPRRVTTLTLIGAFVRLGQNPAVQELNAEAIEPMKDPVDPDFVRSFQESAVGPATSPEIIQRAVAESMKLTADDWKAALAAGMLTDLTHALDRYQRPVLVLHGELDTFSLVEEQQELVRGTGRKLISLAHWGHSPHWEYPADVAAIISSFLDGSEDERRAA